MKREKDGPAGGSSVRLPSDLHKQTKVYAAESNRKVREVVATALAEYLKRQKRGT